MKWADITFKKDNGERVTGDEACTAMRRVLWTTIEPPTASGDVVINERSRRDQKQLTSDARHVKAFLRDVFGDRVEFRDDPSRPPDPDVAVRRRAVNVINVTYEYRVTLRLGDLDALFPPLPRGAREPWKDVGVRQRLQVLGYLYAPLNLPERLLEGPAEKGWAYYRRVHGGIDDPALLAKLADEVRNNVVCAGFPAPGQVFTRSDLPAPGTFGAIRIPGGYCITTPKLGYWRTGASRTPAQHSFPIGARRDEAIKEVWDANPMLGQIPVIATVEKSPTGANQWEHVGADEVEVHFALVDPADLPSDSTHPFRAPALRVTVMNFGAGALEHELPTPQLLAGKNADPDNGLAAPLTEKTPSPNDWDAGRKLARRLTHQATNETRADVERLEREAADAQRVKEGHERRVVAAQALKNELNAELREYERVNTQAESAEYSRVSAAKTDFEALPKPQGNKVMLRNQAANTANTQRAQEAAEKLRRIEEWERQADEHARLFTDALAARNAKLARLPPFSRQAELERANEEYDAADRDRAAADSLRKAKLAQSQVLLSDKVADLVRAALRDRQYDDVSRSAEHVVKQSTTSEVLKDALRGDPNEVFEIAGRGPKVFVERAMRDAAAKVADTDPQRVNAPAEWSGKAGLRLLGALFSARSHRGFHDGHGAFKTFAPATAASDPHAVKTRTNAAGHAGVIFTPSRCGGDRYRLRAYVRTGTSATAREWSATTGTLVVWQNIRIHKVLRHAPAYDPQHRPARLQALFDEADALSRSTPPRVQYPGGFAARGWAEYFEEKCGLASGVSDLTIAATDPLETLPANDPARLRDRKYYRPLEHTFVGLADNLRAGFIELLCDHGQVQPIGRDDLERAFNSFRTAWTRTGECIVGKKVAWDLLAFVDVTSPFLVNLRHLEAYNADLAAKKAAPATGATYQDYAALATNDAENIMRNFAQIHGIQPIAEALMDGGLYPGLTIVQVLHGDTWDLSGFGIAQIFTSGWGGPARGCFVFYSRDKHRNFMCYSASANLVHELGHVLGLPHQSPNPGGDDYMHEKQTANAQTTPTEGETNCVMGYSGCYGEYCGRCVMALRGVRVKTTEWGDPVELQDPRGVLDDGV